MINKNKKSLKNKRIVYLNKKKEKNKKLKSILKNYKISNQISNQI